MQEKVFKIYEEQLVYQLLKGDCMYNKKAEFSELVGKKLLIYKGLKRTVRKRYLPAQMAKSTKWNTIKIVVKTYGLRT